MSENTSNQIQQANGKPVNINISFNISRKQVTQNINALDHEKSFNFKNTNIQENPTTNSKPKIHTSRPLKTPQLAQTDRHIYSKDLQYPRATQELKRKKRRKRNSVDYTNDKTANFPFYPVDIDKSLPTHKRGYTTGIMKKNQSTTTKNKRENSKTYQNVKQNQTVPISAILNQANKTDAKTMKLDKNLKNILNKIINNELSKRSLPLPSVPSKSKYNQSTALTARKISTARPAKKRSSKSHIMPKERVNSSPHINSSNSQMQIFQNPKILEKLGNFKSIQNSILVSEADQNDDNEQYLNKQKSNQQKRIVIKTDQSIECIGEIHDFERNFYQQEFFQDSKKVKHNFGSKKNQYEKGSTSSNTLQLIQTYIKLLNGNDEESLQVDSERYINSKISNNVNEKVEIYEEKNYMSSSDYSKVEELLNSQKHKSKYQQISAEIYQNQWQANLDQSSYRKYQDVRINNDKNQRQYENRVEHNAEQTRKQLIKKQEEQAVISPQKQPQPQSLQEKQQQDFKPFISSQMGREYHYNEIVNTQQREKLNELKKHQFQKWSCLLDYIKSNINSETSTQQVLEQVYDYLSKAKVDLIKEGQNITQGKSSGKGSKIIDYPSNNKNTKQKLDQEFTNKLSSQIEKSSPQIINPKTQSDDLQLNSYHQSKEFHSNKRKLGQLMRSQEEEILDEQTKSFKQDYESSVEQESLKFMNLSTIETALKNRFNQLCHKKDKELEHIDQLFEENKIDEQDYEKQKMEIETLFKKQTNEILIVKKNIWKGYNEAKGILDKSYITSRVEEEFGSMLYNRYEGGSSDKKDRKMMKCLSQSYLGKKRIDYKKFIEEQERKKEQQIEHQGHKRQNVQEEQESSNEDENEQDQYYGQQESQQSQNEQQYHQDENHRSEDTDKDQEQQEQYEEHNQISQQPKNLQENLQSNKSQTKSIDEEFEKIAEKINKLKEQHDVTIANQHQHAKPSKILDESSHEKQSRSINEINEFNIEDHKYLDENIASSPVLVSASPDSSMHYQEIQRSLHAYSDQQSVSDEEKGSKSEESQHSDQYSQQRSQKEYSDEDEKAQDKNIDNQEYNDSDEQYSDSQREIIDRQLTQQTSKSMKNNISPPLKSSVNQTQNHDLEQPVKPQQKVEKIKKQEDPKIKALIKKFKYLTEQDRQDIFEFLFLDLCIELYQQPCHENKLMDSINRYVAKQHQMSRRKKGVKTNINVVKDYLKRFCGYLLRTNKHSLENINVPMGPTAIQMLKYMHENQDFDDVQADENEGIVTLIIPVAIFDTFERSLLPTLEFQKYYDNEEKEHERVNFLKNILHIHNKALFDALNEFLDQQRPFGIWGKPFPWKKSSSFTHKFTEIEQQQKLKKSAQKVVEACSYVCGLLVDKQQSLVGNAKISQGYIEQIREDRISRMLANEMIENEERWVFYDDQQTQVLVEASNFVYNSLLKELLQDLTGLINQ